MTNAKETVITRWEAIMQVKITPAYIALQMQRDNHTLPRSSMAESDFEALGNYIKNKMGNDNVEIVQS